MSENQGNSRVLASAKVEWGLNMESEVTLNVSDGPFKSFTQRGRCKRCWGGLWGRMNEASVITGIKCRVCGTILEGIDAEREEHRIDKESALNLMNMRLGRLPSYNKGVYAYKIFPHIERLTDVELKNRIKISAAKGGVGGKLTRQGFPAGSPGYFHLQA